MTADQRGLYVWEDLLSVFALPWPTHDLAVLPEVLRSLSGPTFFSSSISNNRSYRHIFWYTPGIYFTNFPSSGIFILLVPCILVLAFVIYSHFNMVYISVPKREHHHLPSELCFFFFFFF